MRLRDKRERRNDSRHTSMLEVKQGLIVTLNQEDQLDGIQIIPAWKWITEKQG